MDQKFFLDNFNTQLSPQEEAMFQYWLQAKSAEQNRDMKNDLLDYDLRGAWASDAQQGDDGHFPDTFKKPNHPTFSTGSKYHGTPKQDGGFWKGGVWGPDDGFTPSQEMLDTLDMNRLGQYFWNVEHGKPLKVPFTPKLK